MQHHSSAGDTLPPIPRGRIPVELQAFLVISALLSFASAAYLAVQVATNTSPHHGLPFDFYTQTPFFDLVGMTTRMSEVHEASFFAGIWPYVYPAPAVFLFKIFSLFGRLPIHRPYLGSVFAYLLVVACGLLLLRDRFSKGLQHRGISKPGATIFSWGTLLLSWPIGYAMHQGNIESVLWIGIAGAVLLYRQCRWLEFAALVGIVGACKLYPLIFLLLLIPVKKWREIFFGVLVVLGTTLTALFYIGPNPAVAFQRVNAGVAAFTAVGLSVHGVIRDTIPFDHSLSGLLHRLLYHQPHALGLLLRGYLPGVIGLFLALFFLRVRKLPAGNQLLFLAVCAVTFTPISYDYTLQYLYIPFAWIVLDGVAPTVNFHGPRKLLLAVMVCFAFVFSPELFLTWNGLMFSGQFKAVVLLLLLTLSAAWAFPGGERLDSRVSSCTPATI